MVHDRRAGWDIDVAAERVRTFETFAHARREPALEAVATRASRARARRLRSCHVGQDGAMRTPAHEVSPCTTVVWCS